jgi:hypothetical protein
VTPGPPESEPEAIFVVGASRSGTTLMRHLLELSERIAIAPESHFLGHLRRSEGARYYFRRAGDLHSDETMRRIVELIYSGEFQRRSRWREVSPFWRWLVAKVPREETERQLLAARRDEAGLLTAFLRIYANAKGRPIIGEKTPAHIAYVDTIVDWFPNGRVVHMVRDPRAIYVSDLRRRRKRLTRPYSWFAKVPGLLPLAILLQTTLVWRSAMKHDRTYRQRYPGRYELVRFEDLVRQPVETLAALYTFLGVVMPADPTNVDVTSRGFSEGEHGLDASAADRWRKHIGPFARRWLELSLRRPMRRAGYQRRQ